MEESTLIDSRIPGVRIEIANRRHHSELLEFMLDHFRPEEPITSSVGTTKEDARDFYLDLMASGLRGPHSFVAIEQESGQMIGCRLNEIVDDITSKQPANDYGNPRANQVSGFVYALSANLPALLGARGRSAGGLRVMKFVVIAVNPSWMRRGLGGRLVGLSLDLAAKQRCACVVTAATALKSQKLFTKFGFQTVREIKYNNYKNDEGQVVFHYLKDGATSGKLMLKWI